MLVPQLEVTPNDTSLRWLDLKSPTPSRIKLFPYLIPGVKAIDSDLINPSRNITVRTAIANSITPQGSIHPEDIIIDKVITSDIIGGTATISVIIQGWVDSSGTLHHNYTTTYSLMGLEKPTSTVNADRNITVEGVYPTVSAIQSSSQVKAKIKGLVTNEPMDPVGFDVYSVIVSAPDIDPFSGIATNVAAVFNKWWPDEMSHTVHDITIHGLVSTNSSFVGLPSTPITSINEVKEVTALTFKENFDIHENIITAIQNFLHQGNYVSNVKHPMPEMYHISNPTLIEDEPTQIMVDVAIKPGHFYENGTTIAQPLGALTIEGFKKPASQWKNDTDAFTIDSSTFEIVPLAHPYAIMHNVELKQSIINHIEHPYQPLTVSDVMIDVSHQDINKLDRTARVSASVSNCTDSNGTNSTLTSNNIQLIGLDNVNSSLISPTPTINGSNLGDIHPFIVNFMAHEATIKSLIVEHKDDIFMNLDETNGSLQTSDLELTPPDDSNINLIDGTITLQGNIKRVFYVDGKPLAEGKNFHIILSGFNAPYMTPSQWKSNEAISNVILQAWAQNYSQFTADITNDINAATAALNGIQPSAIANHVNVNGFETSISGWSVVPKANEKNQFAVSFSVANWFTNPSNPYIQSSYVIESRTVTVTTLATPPNISLDDKVDVQQIVATAESAGRAPGVSDVTKVVSDTYRDGVATSISRILKENTTHHEWASVHQEVHHMIQEYTSVSVNSSGYITSANTDVKMLNTWLKNKHVELDGRISGSVSYHSYHEILPWWGWLLIGLGLLGLAATIIVIVTHRPSRDEAA